MGGGPMAELTLAQRAWIDALRSGQYQQSRGLMQTPEGYCCLGVACVVAEQHGVPVRQDCGGFLVGPDLRSHPAVMAWIGLRTVGGATPCDVRPACIVMNDLRGWDFARIADELESAPELYFVQPGEDG